MVDVVISIVAFLIQIFLGVILGIFSVYLALRFFDKMTEGVDEIKELKKGNVAVAIVLLSLIISIGTIVSNGIRQFELTFTTQMSPEMFVISFVMAIVQIVIIILIAVVAIYVAIRVLDTMTVGINELTELKKGNVAVALMIGAVIYIVSFIISNALESVGELIIFKAETLASLLGIK